MLKDTFAVDYKISDYVDSIRKYYHCRNLNFSVRKKGINLFMANDRKGMLLCYQLKVPVDGEEETTLG